MAVIDESVVRISPDFRGFKTALKAGLRDAQSGITGKVQIAPECRGLKTAIRECVKEATQGVTAKVAVDVDCAHLKRSIRDCVAGMPTLKVKVDTVAGTHRGATVSSSATRGRQSRATARRSGGVGRAGTGLLGAAESTANALRLMDIQPARITSLTAAAIGLSPVLLAVASSAGLAGSSVVALGAAAIGTVNAGLAMKFAFTGVVEALKASKAAEKAQVTAGATAAAKRLADARAITAAQRAVASAERSVADAHRDAIGAQQNVTEAQLGLNDARKQAINDLIDMRDLVHDFALDEEGATIALLRAREKQFQILNDQRSPLDRREAAYRVAAAEDRLFDVRRERARSIKELAEQEKAGIEGSDLVVSANKRLTDAHEKLAEAQRRIVDANRDVIEANQRLAETKLKQTLDGGTAAAADLADKLAKLSPAGRALFHWFKAQEPMFAKFRRGVEQATLPGFLTFLRAVAARGKSGTSALTIMQGAITDLGRTTGTTVGRLGKLFGTDYVKGRLIKVNKENQKSFQNLNDTILILTRPLIRLIAAAAPQLTRLTAYVEKLAGSFAAWIGTFSDADLSAYFRRAGDELSKWWLIASNLGRIVLGVFGVSLPTGSDLVTRLGEFTTRIREWVESKRGQDRIREFFDYFKRIDYAKMAKVVGQALALSAMFKIGTFIAKHPVLALLTLLSAKYPEETAIFLDRATSAIGGVLEWVNNNQGAATTLLAILAGYKALAGLSQLKLPGIPGLGNLAQRTTVMNVTATTVNILGPPVAGAAKGAAAAGGKGGGKVAQGLRGVGAALGAVLVVDIILGAGQTFKGVAAMLQGPEAYGKWSREMAPTFKRFFSHELPEFLVSGDNGWGSVGDAISNDIKRASETGLGHWFSTTLPNALNLGVGSGGWAGLGRNVGRWFSHTLPQAFLSSDAIREHGGGWSGFWSKFMDELTSPLASIVLGAPLLTAGRDLIQGLWNGAVEKTLQFRDWIAHKAWDLIGPAISGALGVRSPSVKTKPMGADLVGGLVRGFIGAIPAAIKSLAAGALGLVRAFASPFAGVIGHIAPHVLSVLKWIDVNLIGKLNVLLRAIKLPEIPPIIAAGKGTMKHKAATQGFGAAGHARGGTIRGSSPHSRADNIPIWATAKEYIQPVDAVEHYGLDFMEAVRSKRFPRFALGGQVGFLDDMVDRFTKNAAPPGVVRDISAAALKAVPAAALKLVGGIFSGGGGGGPGGAGPGFLPWPSSPSAQRGDTGVWRSILSLVRASGIPYEFGNAYRDGDPKWHGSGRGLDLMGFEQDTLAQFFMARMKNVLELIHTTSKGGYYITRGQRRASMGEQDALHRNHLHVAMAGGGLVVPNAPVFDFGGVLAPGLNVVDNRTGHAEEVRPVRQGGGDRHIHLHINGPVGSQRELQTWIIQVRDQLRREGRW
jgi:hypothetical protein